MLALEILYSLLLYSLFGVVHSILASNRVKQKVVENLGDKIAFYRFGYNIISALLIYIIWELLPDLTQVVYDLPNPFDLIILIFQLVGIVGFFWTTKYLCVKEFLGFSQIDRYFAGIYYKDELDENLTLNIIGPYRITRHPIYFFSIIIILFRPYMDLQYLLFAVSAVIYFYIGSYFEEKKLLNKFGNEYLDYSSKVARIIPYKIFTR